MRTLLLAVAFAVAIASVCVTQPENLSRRTLTFAQRVSYQRAIEEVYWRHRIWPKENPNPKPSLDAVMSQAQLENKVAGYLRDSLALENSWHRPITAEQLQAGMDRMARNTKQPQVLRELFEALGNEPAVIAECLARPILTERLIANFSAQGQTRQVESPQTDALRTMSAAATLGQVVYTLPEIADTCTDDTWTATTTANALLARTDHTAVWTGSEMIVWGGASSLSDPVYFNTGGRYNPSTDSWTATSTTNAPTARSSHTAVWTGSEMIVWGGFNGTQTVNTGGRYNPAMDSWTATSITNAPSARASHTAVWTGSEMIVWGGSADQFTALNTGGKYNPSTNSWIATSTTNAPSARASHTAVWTGSQMIVWGGDSGVNSGGRYNPNTDNWAATSTANAPSPRYLHTAVWTGSEMIVWGGFYSPPPMALNTGGRYNPITNSWALTNTTDAPSARFDHTAVWTGIQMIVWGGIDGDNTGGKYNPSTNSWIATSITNAPAGRYRHTAVGTGSEMIVWGGIDVNQLVSLNTGGKYCAQFAPPTPTPTVIPTATPTPTASPTPTPTPTPCMGRCAPTPRPRPTPPPRQ
jgi:N-acetylneuraminic acid mutarotase